MSWKRPIWFWIVFYFLWSIGGAFTLCAYALAMMTKDGVGVGPVFYLALVLMAASGAVGGAAICALLQFGRWLYDMVYTKPTKTR